jgi:hypothetical protein
MGQCSSVPTQRLPISTLFEIMSKPEPPLTRSEELTAWVGTERGLKEPIHIASEGEDLLGDLKQGLSYVRKQQKVEAPESDRMK